MQLSIIIPYYNAKETTDAILDVLAPQMPSKDVEVVIIDDGSKEKYKTSYKWAKVYRQKNAGSGGARNTGMDKAKGEYIRNRLAECKNVISVTGLGLMLGIETTKDAKDVVMNCIDKGVLPLTAKNKIRLLPPLNISDSDLEKAMNIITEVIEE